MTPRPDKAEPLVVWSESCSVQWLCQVLGRAWPPMRRVVHCHGALRSATTRLPRRLDVRPAVYDGIGRDVTGKA